VKLRLKHGHYWDIGAVDAFDDSVLAGGTPLPKLSPMTISGSGASAQVKRGPPTAKAELHFTFDGGEWQKRVWQSVDATLVNGRISTELPPQRPLVCYLSVTDERGLQVTTAHEELP
jgi:hypothetical protein